MDMAIRPSGSHLVDSKSSRLRCNGGFLNGRGRMSRLVVGHLVDNAGAHSTHGCLQSHCLIPRWRRIDRSVDRLHGCGEVRGQVGVLVLIPKLQIVRMGLGHLVIVHHILVSRTGEGGVSSGREVGKGFAQVLRPVLLLHLVRGVVASLERVMIWVLVQVIVWLEREVLGVQVGRVAAGRPQWRLVVVALVHGLGVEGF